MAKFPGFPGFQVGGHPECMSESPGMRSSCQLNYTLITGANDSGCHKVIFLIAGPLEINEFLSTS